MRLDLKDKKIIYELEKDARITNSAISQIVDLSKDAVGYRIKQLEKNGFIKGYRAVIDSNKLGFQVFRVYFSLIDITQEQLEAMVNYLKELKQTWWIADLDGEWDFVFAYRAKSNKDFNDFYFQFSKKFRRHIKNKLITPLTFYRELPKRYFVDSPEDISFDFSSLPVKVDKTDLAILKILSDNGRISILNLAKTISIDVKTAKSRINRLEKERVILSYKADLAVSKIGMVYYTLQIDLNSYDNYYVIRDELLSYKETTSWIVSVGGYDIECDMELKDAPAFYDLTRNLKSKYPEIRELKYYRVIESYKAKYMPDVV